MELKLFALIEVLAILPSRSCATQPGTCTGHQDCLKGGTCEDGTSELSCACAQCFTGNHCEIDINDCAGHSRCLNGGTYVDGTNSFTCTCADAFLGDYCEYQNKCVHSGTCIMLNTLSRDAECKCREGYAPDLNNGRRCEPVDKNLNKNASLIFGTFGSGGGIDQFSLGQQSVTRIQNYSRMGWALDVMYRTNTMFWSGRHGNIYTAPIRDGAAKTVIPNDSGSYILCLAVDWVYSHLYFSDRYRKTISVTSLDRSMTKVILSTQVTETYGIVVDPLSGWIYWADFFSRNIERAALNGSKRKILAITEPQTPHGLALDMAYGRLYWATSNSIHSINVDGSDQKLVFQATPPTFSRSDFYSIATFGDFVYWRDYDTKPVYRTNKCGGGEATAVHSTAGYFDSWLHLQVYHFSKQPEGVNYCENRIGGQCSHLCFRVPSTGNETVTTTCACPDGHKFSYDQRTCT